MLAQNVGLSLRLGDSQPDARSHQLTPGHIELAVNAFLQALLADELGLFCGCLRFARGRRSWP